MTRPTTPARYPLGPFALVVIGIEMLAVVLIVGYAFTGSANAGRAATWFGEHATGSRR